MDRPQTSSQTPSNGGSALPGVATAPLPAQVPPSIVPKDAPLPLTIATAPGVLSANLPSAQAVPLGDPARPVNDRPTSLPQPRFASDPFPVSAFAGQYVLPNNSNSYAQPPAGTPPNPTVPVIQREGVVRPGGFPQQQREVPTNMGGDGSEPKEVTATITNIANAIPELMSNANGDVIQTTSANEVVPMEGESSSALNVIPPKSGQTYVDITEYLNMPQSDAAKKLGVPTSTLSKRWKEAVRGRKWPYRMVCKLDKEIMTLLHNIPQGPGAPPLPEEVEATLGLLIRKRSEELKPVVIRI